MQNDCKGDVERRSTPTTLRATTTMAKTVDHVVTSSEKMMIFCSLVAFKIEDSW
jgi:hypothetical protein